MAYTGSTPRDRRTLLKVQVWERVENSLVQVYGGRGGEGGGGIRHYGL